MYGSHGRCLLVDLGSRTSDIVPIPEIVRHRLLGGVGLASYLLYRFCPIGVDPLSPENPLIFTSSPFIGTGITTASKIAIATKSPQTGMIGDSLSSSYLALALKRTGFDGLVITGRAAKPSVLVIDDDRVRYLPAGHLLGLDPAATSSAVRAELGKGFRVAAIGVAGERGVRYASISNDGRLAGRSGTGAVMGGKNLKAVAIRGSTLPAVARPHELASAARELAARSLGAGTAKYREIGTAANVSFFNRMGVLPTRNFQAGRFEDAEAISGETLFLEHRTDKHGCAACTIGCEHHYRTKDSGPAKDVRLEYETLFALGSLCGVGEPNTVLRAASLCNELGIDAISTGATIAWAMECAELGVSLGSAASEIPRFGDADGLLRMIAAIGHRDGIGDVLAEGSRRAAALTGRGSEAWAMHVKGLEMPGYDPRKLRTLALGLAVCTRGACHNRSSAYETDLSEQLQSLESPPVRARAAAASEDQAAVLDSLTLCKFLRHCFDDLFGESAGLYSLVTGHATTGDEIRRAGERINNLKKLFNIREGWTAADDTLPPRAMAESGSEDGLTRHQLQELIAAYYQIRGWDERGIISDEHLNDIGLADLFNLESSKPQQRSLL